MVSNSKVHLVPLRSSMVKVHLVPPRSSMVMVHLVLLWSSMVKVHLVLLCSHNPSPEGLWGTEVRAKSKCCAPFKWAQHHYC